MDTTHLEYTAEDLIAHKLQRNGLLVAKPKFDREGTDLIALLEVADGAKFCRIQCKGRSLKNSESSNIKIPSNYVKGAFFVFLYVDIGDKETYIFCFSVDDIKTKWGLKAEETSQKEFYTLNIYKNTFLNPDSDNNILAYSFSKDKIEKIKIIIKKSISGEEIKLFELIKLQKDLLEKTKKHSALKELITKYTHIQEMSELQGKNLDLLVQQYEDKLVDLTKEIPDEFLQKLKELSKKYSNAKDIIIQLKSELPKDLPESILEDYISKVLLFNNNLTNKVRLCEWSEPQSEPFVGQAR